MTTPSPNVAEPMTGATPIAHARHADKDELVASLSMAEPLMDAVDPRIEYAPTPSVAPGAEVDYVPGPGEPAFPAPTPASARGF